MNDVLYSVGSMYVLVCIVHSLADSVLMAITYFPSNITYILKADMMLMMRSKDYVSHFLWQVVKTERHAIFFLELWSIPNVLHFGMCAKACSSL